MKGKLFYVIGASGVGKDALINYARQRINGGWPVIFAHRYITRPAGVGNENHVCLSVEEFKGRRAGGLFLFHWESHGLHYGIGVEVKMWLEQGFTVVLNGSREYLEEAQRRCVGLQVVLIDARAEVIRQRLEGRGRESAGEIEERLMRSRLLPAVVAEGLITVHNNGLLVEGGEALVRVVEGGVEAVRVG